MTMQRQFSTLTLIVGPVAVALIGTLAAANVGPVLAPLDYQGVVALVIVALLAETVAIDFRVGAGAQQPQSSLAFLPFLGSVVLFSPFVAVLCVSFVVATSQLVLRRHTPARALYNVSQAAISVGLASVLYHSWAGAHDAVNFVAFPFAAATFFIANIFLATCAIAFLRRQAFIRTLEQVAGPNGSNVWYDLLASPIALILVILYYLFDPYRVAGVLLVVLPLILINYSYLSKQKVMKATQDLLRALVKAIETRDPYTSGHSWRVSTLAKLIASDMGMSFWRIHKVETAALLHDIGKIDPVYATVLRKPFDLSPEERALIQTHSARGAEMLQDLRSVEQDVVAAVLHHHERYDGKGYPAGLSGDRIPLTARIIMMCDSIDAMLSDRPYRKALTVDAVRQELVRCSGTQFDPEIVGVVLTRGTLERAVELIASIRAEETSELMVV